MAEHWAAFQYEIYLGGTAGAMPRLPTGPTRLEELAEHRLVASPVGHVAGSAGGGAPTSMTSPSTGSPVWNT